MLKSSSTRETFSFKQTCCQVLYTNVFIYSEAAVKTLKQACYPLTIQELRINKLSSFTTEELKT